ncbi:MAG: hypothetical protein LV480_09930 [Methylacidiphilales bacterium]|nr:hypothetical protein [Candidatus Methylacidiphilales bacterium]
MEPVWSESKGTFANKEPVILVEGSVQRIVHRFVIPANTRKTIMSESDKVIAVFRELVGERVSRLEGSHYPADVNTRITAALTEGGIEEKDLLKKDSIGFHLVDWQRNAAFIVALTLFPEKFTNEEIREEVDSFLWHVPAHVLEAARLGGYPTENIFKEESENTSE